MLDIKFLRDNLDFVQANLRKREGFDISIVNKVLNEDKKFREIKNELDYLKSQKNKENKQIAQIKKEGGNIEAQLNLVRSLTEEISVKESNLNSVLKGRDELLLRIPNLLDSKVPIGKSDEENVPVRVIGDKPTFDFSPRNHQELCLLNNWFDLDAAAKSSGARFYYLKNELVLLQIALYSYVLSKLSSKGYIPVEVPPMVRRSVLENSVSMEDFEDVIYKIEDEDLYLIGTSEHTLAALHVDTIFARKDLPVKYAGISPCFRKEAGVTKDSKGIFRVHNFNKIEQFIFSTQDESDNLLEELVSNVEEIFSELEIHYQIVDICSGDIGSFAARKFDLEAYLPGQEKFREMVSASNYRDYGARRLNCRYQDSNNEIKFIHTLNSTAIALTRTLIAIIETHQTADGNVRLPKVLRPYFNNREFLVNK